MKKKTGGKVPSLKGIIVLEYLKKFPSTPKLTLARTIYKDNKAVFKDVEDVRGRINYYTGTHGAEHKKTINKENLVQRNSFGLPKSDTVEQYPYVIPVKNSRALIISDIHFPYHDEEALRQSLLYGLEKEVDTIIINGDLFDFYQISRFEKNPKNRNLAGELEMGRMFFERLRELFPTQLIVYYLGNHDTRYAKYLYAKAPELLGIPEIELQYILKLNEYKIIFADNERGITFGDLNIRHGHEFFGSGGVHPARTYYLKAKQNILVSHVHRTSFFQTIDIKRKVHGGWSIGCLSELSPDYNKNSDYNHGFAFAIKDKTGKFIVENKMIINGKIL